MKGVIFTEFLEMVEDEFSPEMVDQIIESSSLASEGAYTSLGNYSHHEILQLVENLSQETEIPVADLVREFGKHLIEQFVYGHQDFFTEVTTVFAFLENVEKRVHVEVKKLYPDAHPPSFEYDHQASGCLTIMYRSKRPFSDLAEGLILGAIDYFGESIHLIRQDMSTEAGFATQFTLTKQEQSYERHLDSRKTIGTGT
jgi:hypothetical protein